MRISDWSSDVCSSDLSFERSLIMLDILRDYGVFFLIGQYPHGQLGGLSITILLSVCALILSFPLGLVMGVCQVSPLRSIRVPVALVVYLLRATPLLMIIFWIYFLLPLWLGGSPNRFFTVLISLVIFEGAYISIIVQCGIDGLAKGQMESARALGFSYGRAMTLVVMPQVLRNMLPSLIGEFVSIITLTSLGYVVSLSEITFVADQINGQTITEPAAVYTLLVLSYFIMCFGITRLSYWLERRMFAKRPNGK